MNLVWTDSAYGVIELHQMRKFGRLAGTKFTNPDLVALAESFGLRRACGSGRPTSSMPTLRRAFELETCVRG